MDKPDIDGDRSRRMREVLAAHQENILRDWTARIRQQRIGEGLSDPAIRDHLPMILSQIAFALGACCGLARILIPSAWNTASKGPVNWPARSLIRNLTEAERWPRSIRKLRAACVVHAASGFAVMPAR